MGIVIEIDLNITAYEEIEKAVVIEIQKSSTGAEIEPVFPIGMRIHARLGSDVLESPASFAVADIVKENIRLAIAGEKKIGKAVVVDVADGDALPAADVSEADFVGDITEPAAAQILE